MKKRWAVLTAVTLILVLAVAGCGAASSPSGGSANTNSAASPTSSTASSSNTTASPTSGTTTSSSAQNTGAGKKLVIRIATGTAVDHPENIGARKFKELAEKAGNGSIEVQIFPNGQLGSQTDWEKALRNGTLEITMVTPGLFAEYAPVLNTVELPYLIDSPDQGQKVINSPVADEIRNIVDAQGVHILAFWDAGLRELTNSKRPIKEPSDLTGLKIRVPQSKANIDTWKALGANAVPMAYNDLYMALKQDVVDGQENPPSNIYNSKLYEAQKYLSMTNHLQMIHMFMYSGKLWDQLPSDTQKIITDAAVEAGKYQWQVTIQQDQQLVDKLKSLGMQVNEVDTPAFKAKVQPLQAEYVKEYGSEAQKLIDGIKAAEGQ